MYRTLLENIPDYQSFMTVDEMDASSRALASAYPEAVSLSEIGKTREGHPLLCLKIGSGRKTALVFGLPHPNEPIGAMMLEYFTAELAKNPDLRDALGYTWYFVKAWDADGARKNEGWFKGPFTITDYMRNFFRPAGFEQVDWTFPIDHKELHFHDTLPETEAMMALIDDIRPDFIYALHNSGFGGVYWYMSHPCPAVYEALHGIPSKYDVPLHLGEPESPVSEVFAPAIYSELGAAAAYDFIERHVGDLIGEWVKTHRSGDNSASYAGQRFGTFTFLTELPYFYDPRINDTNPSDITRRDALMQQYEDGAAMNAELRSILAQLRESLPPDNPYLLAVDDLTADDPGALEMLNGAAKDDPAYTRPATVAEKFDISSVSKFYKATLYGMLLRAAETECDIDSAKQASLEEGRRKAQEVFDRVTGALETETNYSIIPIKTLIGIQLECGLIMADFLLHSEDGNVRENV